jgi:hypothetical protein
MGVSLHVLLLVEDQSSRLPCLLVWRIAADVAKLPGARRRAVAYIDKILKGAAISSQAAGPRRGAPVAKTFKQRRSN